MYISNGVYALLKLLIHLSLTEPCKDQYYHDRNQDKCIACPENAYQPNRGSTSCMTCAPGQVPNKEKTRCEGKITSLFIVRTFELKCLMS